jgi:hypothetical protein
MNKIVSLFLFFIPSALFSQSFDLRADSFFTATSDSVYNQYTNIQFSANLTLVDGNFIPEGTTLDFNYTVNGSFQFSSSYTLQDTLTNGESLIIDSPNFILNQTGDFSYCIQLNVAGDTNELNDLACRVFEVIPLQSTPEKIDENEINVFYTSGRWNIYSVNRILNIWVYDFKGRLLLEKRQNVIQNQITLNGLREHSKLIILVETYKGTVSKKVIRL